jgi:hypothetical protein
MPVVEVVVLQVHQEVAVLVEQGAAEQAET